MTGPTVVTGGAGVAGEGGWALLGGGRWEVDVPLVSVLPVEAADDAAAGSPRGPRPSG